MESEPGRPPRKPRWGPRVQRHHLQRLYETAAQGRLDEDLVDDVGTTLYLRCRSILTVHDILHKRVLPCPSCEQTIALVDTGWSWSDPESSLRCDRCGWTMTWGDYWATFRHQELGGTGAVDIFAEYLASWEAARTAQERFLAIDRVIHRWHWETVEERPSFGLGRPTAVNLIEGNRQQVIAFLDSLSYGENSPGELRATREAWQAHWREVKERQDAYRRRRNVPNSPTAGPPASLRADVPSQEGRGSVTER